MNQDEMGRGGGGHQSSLGRAAMGSAGTGIPENDARPDENYPIRIARDGTWFHEGAPIGRIELVKLFATVLRRDADGQYWLITPAERGRIHVEDAPFLAVELRREGEGDTARLTFRTNLDQEVTAGPEHPIRVVTDPDSGEPAPYLVVRGTIEARINRATFYDLVEHAVEHLEAGRLRLGVWSNGAFFPLDSDAQA